MRGSSCSSSSSCLLLLQELTKSWLFVTLSLSLVVTMSFSATPTEAAPFSSWAGKRSEGGHGGAPDLAQLLHDLQEFYMLQGSRYPAAPTELDYMPPSAEKRAPFSSWAGKRAPFSSWAGKRAPFSSWAGKRSGGPQPQEQDSFLDDSDIAEMEAKHRIKRSSVEDEPFVHQIQEEGDSLEDHTRQRRGANQFSAWGGKRNQLHNRFTRNAPNNLLVPVKVMRPQRAAFSAWGG